MRVVCIALAGIACIVLDVLPCPANVVFVDRNASGANDGTSWVDAFTDLAVALKSANPGDQVWVADGVYVPTTGADRAAAFVLLSGIEVYGGFAGGEKKLKDRNCLLHRSVLSGDIGVSGRHRDNSYHIIEAVDLERPPRIDGFLVTRSQNDPVPPRGRGGGLYVLRTNLSVLNCEFQKNRAGGGGAMWIEDSTVTVEDCLIRNNRNRAVTTDSADVTFTRCSFVRNPCKADGGAIGAYVGSRIEASGCTFSGNTAAYDGGAYWGTGEGTFIGCVFSRNRCNSWGGGVYQFGGPLHVSECTFAGNFARYGAGGLVGVHATTVVNCALWGNTAQGGDRERQQLWLDENLDINYCLVEGWTGRGGGEGNFDADPKWIDAGGGNLRIGYDSPCVDAGSDEAVTEAVDLDGNPRILGGRVDIGAYENVCGEVIDLAASMVEDDAEGHVGDGDGVCEPGEDCVLTAVVTVNAETLPEGSTVRVAFAPVDENGEPDPDPCCAEHACGPDARCPKVRKARIDAAGQGTGILPLAGCADGAWSVCIEGCGEGLCREIQCP